MPVSISNNLRQLRLDHHITQSELAKKIGKSPGYISLIETGRVDLNDQTKQEIPAALGISGDEIKSCDQSLEQNTDIPSRLKQLRVDHQLSQRAMGKKVGCSDAIISMVETGIQEPSEDLLNMISKAFNVSADWLLTGHEADEAEVQEEMGIIDNYFSAHTLARKKIIQMIKDGTL